MAKLKKIAKNIIFAPFAIATVLSGIILILTAIMFSVNICITSLVAKKLGYELDSKIKMEVEP